MERFIAACIQMNSLPLRITENIIKIKSSVRKVKDEFNADLIVLPETIVTSFAPDLGISELYELATDIPGNLTDEICDMCKSLRVHIVLPFYEKGHNKEEVYNSAVLIDDNGRIVGTYRKTHPFPTEKNVKAGFQVPVFNTRLAKIGIIICYDGDFPELARIMALQGAEIIVRPSAFLRSFEIWDLTNRARAFDNHIYLLATNAVGLDASGNYHYGHSMIVNPIAQKLAQARGGEDVIACELDPDPLRYVSYGSKAPMVYNHLEDRNLDAYGKLILKSAKSPFPTYKRRNPE